jgi:hypothetical protein
LLDLQVTHPQAQYAYENGLCTTQYKPAPGNCLCTSANVSEGASHDRNLKMLSSSVGDL